MIAALSTSRHTKASISPMMDSRKKIAGALDARMIAFGLTAGHCDGCEVERKGELSSWKAKELSW